MRRQISLSFCLALFAIAALAQEKEVPLRYNPVIRQYLKDHPAEAKQKRRAPGDTLQLPIWQDFSNNPGFFPVDSIWLDNDVYINNGYPLNPPSIGVATFDGLDSRGLPYAESGDNSTVRCDYLTSKPIDLSGLSEDDSVFISFYYQTGGLGEMPGKLDSFLLQFKPEVDSLGWITQWFVLGVDPRQDEKHPKANFKQVILPVKEIADTNYFYNGFQFRFIGAGSPTGAVDHWHLDYLRLDDDRGISDTIYNDLAFSRPPNGMLNIYRSMPWRHYRARTGEYKPKRLRFYRFNNSDHSTIGTEQRNTSLGYSITNLNNGVELINTLTGGSGPMVTNMTAFSRVDTSQAFEFADFQQQPNDDGTISFELRQETFATTGPERQNLPNNEVSHIQFFGNDFAYDDGTAETGYGLDERASRGKVALGFRLERRDTLRYIAIHFTSADDAVNRFRTFDLRVWGQIGPAGESDENDEILATLSDVNPVYTGYSNGFALYELPEPLVLEGEFYIGWEQYNSFVMNVGYDRSYRFFNNSQPNQDLHYYTNGKWRDASLLGTPMMRPVFGHPFIVGQDERQKEQLRLEAFPNPFDNQIYLQLPDDGRYELRVINSAGQQVYLANQNGGQIAINSADWPKGLYILQAFSLDRASQPKSIKLMKQ